MKYLLILALLVIFSCKSDDCESTIDNSTAYPKLAEADAFSILDSGLEGVDCGFLIYASLDSFKTEERFFIVDSLPSNIQTGLEFGYRGILKIENRFGTCINPISEGNQNETYQYANILYWELLR